MSCYLAICGPCGQNRSRRRTSNMNAKQVMSRRKFSNCLHSYTQRKKVQHVGKKRSNNLQHTQHTQAKSEGPTHAGKLQHTGVQPEIAGRGAQARRGPFVYARAFFCVCWTFGFCFLCVLCVLQHVLLLCPSVGPSSPGGTCGRAKANN
jgi:hypothetical protein